uniref:Uncharacterized protein n=1 Tax=Vitis vinifera TaxID=29760 RepID=A5BW44_VITVI|nr:hypothetical protein VITISV_024289 [Vitis vinifera]
MLAEDALRVNAIRGSGHTYPGKLKRLLSHPAVRYPDAIRINSIRISQEDTRRALLFGFPLVEAQNTREHHTSDDSISYPDMLSGSLTNVSKPCYNSRSAALRWCVRTSFAHCIPDLLMANDFKVSVLHVSELSIALPWIPKNSP